jgi:cell shape-determining protein MreC
MAFYTHNKVGSGRAARSLFQHRDVVNIDSSWKTWWTSAVHVCFYRDVIPIKLWCFGFFLIAVLFAAQTLNFVIVGAAIASFVLAGISHSYAVNHLCDEEANELYERPHTYDNAITRAKQEVRERQAVEQARDVLEKERKRNAPLPPKNQNQNRPPRKPY